MDQLVAGILSKPLPPEPTPIIVVACFHSGCDTGQQLREHCKATALLQPRHAGTTAPAANANATTTKLAAPATKPRRNQAGSTTTQPSVIASSVRLHSSAGSFLDKLPAFCL